MKLRQANKIIKKAILWQCRKPVRWSTYNKALYRFRLDVLKLLYRRNGIL